MKIILCLMLCSLSSCTWFNFMRNSPQSLEREGGREGGRGKGGRGNDDNVIIKRQCEWTILSPTSSVTSVSKFQNKLRISGSGVYVYCLWAV